MSSEYSNNDRETLSPRDGGTWAEFGVYKVAEGGYRVPLSLPLDSLRAVNVYVIVGESSVSLIDSGAAPAQSWKQLGQALSTIGVELGDIDRVLATHIHYDHYGQATRLRHSAGAFVFLGAGERASLERIVYNRESLRPRMEKILREQGAADLLGAMKQLTIGAASEGFEMPDEYLGERVIDLGGRSVEAVHTPGHTSGHMNFYDRANSLLFAGDHVLPQPSHRESTPSPWSGLRRSPRASRRAIAAPRTPLGGSSRGRRCEGDDIVRRIQGIALDEARGEVLNAGHAE